jgi:hypothetical protein
MVVIKREGFGAEKGAGNEAKVKRAVWVTRFRQGK